MILTKDFQEFVEFIQVYSTSQINLPPSQTSTKFLASLRLRVKPS